MFWVLVGLTLGAVCATLLFALWRLVFRRPRNGNLDVLLLGASGLTLVIVLMGYQFFYAERLPKDFQRLMGYCLMAAVGGTACVAFSKVE